MTEHVYGTLQVEITEATQYATVYFYKTNLPLGTLQRRRVGEGGFNWRVFTTDGKEVFASNFVSTCLGKLYRYLREENN